MSVDDVDVGTLRSLGLQGFQTWPHGPNDLKPSVIAKRLGMSVDAVRDRIARMEKSGIIAGYELTPNLRLFGHEVTSFHFRLAEGTRRGRTLKEAEAVDGVCSVTGFLSHDVCIDIAHRTPEELERRVQVLGRLLGDASPYSWYEFRLPRMRRELSHIDWRILQAMRGRGRRSLDEVAAELRVSAKTVKRRYDQMAKDGAFDVTANVDPGAFSGQILFLLFLHLRRGATDREVQALLGTYADRWFFSGTPPGGAQRSVYVALLTRSMRDADALAREAESIPGVDRAEALLPVHLVPTVAWIDEAIAERVRFTAPRREASAPRLVASAARRTRIRA